MLRARPRASSRPARCTTSTPRASRPSRRRPARPAGPRACRSGHGHGGGGVVLGREDVARAPAHLGAERRERLDEHGGLDRHVQRADDARALERLRVGVLGAGLHQAGHLVLGQLDLLAAEVGQGEVGDLEVLRGGVRCSCRLHGSVVVVSSAGLGEQALVLLLLEAQPVGRGHVLGLGRAGLEPRLNRVAQCGRRGSGEARSRRRRGSVVLGEQLAQRAQALQLAGPVEAVARLRARGARSAPRARCSAAFAATSRWSPPPR